MSGPIGLTPHKDIHATMNTPPQSKALGFTITGNMATKRFQLDGKELCFTVFIKEAKTPAEVKQRDEFLSQFTDEKIEAGGRLAKSLGLGKNPDVVNIGFKFENGNLKEAVQNFKDKTFKSINQDYFTNLKGPLADSNDEKDQKLLKKLTKQEDLFFKTMHSWNVNHPLPDNGNGGKVAIKAEAEITTPKSKPPVPPKLKRRMAPNANAETVKGVKPQIPEKPEHLKAPKINSNNEDLDIDPESDIYGSESIMSDEESEIENL